MILTLITTLRCDLKCAHCLRGYPVERPDFPIDLLPRLLVEAKPFGTTHVSLTGGEPHLHPRFEQMINMIVHAGYTWSVVSNGMRTEPYIPVLDRFGDQLTHITLSIDGTTPETHNAIRGSTDAFERVTAAARHYVNLGIKVRISVSLNQTNQHELESFVELANDLGAQSISFGGTIPATWNTQLQLSDKDRQALHRRIEELKQVTDYPIKHLSSLRSGDGVYFCANIQLNVLTFNPRGDFLFCCDMNSFGAVIGSLYRQPLAELVKLWLRRSAELQRLRIDLLQQVKTPPGFDSCAFCARSC